jgi:hypothetical protein
MIGTDPGQVVAKLSDFGFTVHIDHEYHLSLKIQEKGTRYVYYHYYYYHYYCYYYHYHHYQCELLVQ